MVGRAEGKTVNLGAGNFTLQMNLVQTNHESLRPGHAARKITPGRSLRGVIGSPTQFRRVALTYPPRIKAVCSKSPPGSSRI